jgi:hypothetical protein
MPYKIGIIGAARRHQGTGAFIARALANLGHDICGVVGTSKESTAQACADLSTNYNINTQGYTHCNELLQQHALDILVIASPPATHLNYLKWAVDNHLHIFCEKPFWWPENTNLALAEYEQTLQTIISASNKNQRYIHLNTQWPYTLKDFASLHPSAMVDHQIEQFGMYLSPQSLGINMLVDAASHGLSMLYQLVGYGDLSNIEVKHQAQSALINFDYLHQQGCTKTTLGFIQSDETPKPASYQINGYRVNRTVSLPEYQIQLQSDQRTISIQDPLDASVQDFLASIEAGLAIDEDALLLGARHLHQLIENY